MGARTYVPMLGRFTRPDPANSFSLFNPQSLNRYAYGLNNPVKYIDPDGKTALVAAGVGARIVQISKSALLGAAVGAGVRVILNGLIRFDHPNYSIWTGVTGSAVTGAITGGVSAQTTLAKFGANVVGVAAGALVNGIKAGQLADQLTVSAVSGVAAGALTRVGDVWLSAGGGEVAGTGLDYHQADSRRRDERPTEAARRALTNIGLLDGGNTIFSRSSEAAWHNGSASLCLIRVRRLLDEQRSGICRKPGESPTNAPRHWDGRWQSCSAARGVPVGC